MSPLRAIVVSILAVAWMGPGCATTPAAPVLAKPAPSMSVAVELPPADYERYRAAADALRNFDSGGSVTRIRWQRDRVLFTRLGERYACDLDTGDVQSLDDADADGRPRAGARRGGGRRGPGRGRQRAREESPDGQWVAVCRDWNVIIERADAEDSETDDGEGKAASDPAALVAEIPVTTDGHRKHRYGTASWVYGEELRQNRAMWWSDDSRRLVYYEFDERDVPDFYLVGGLTARRTSTLIEGYPKPGEANPIASLHVYDLDTGITRRLDTTDDDGGEWYVYFVRFAPDGHTLLVNRTNRHQNVLHVEAYDLDSGARRRIVTETQETWQDNRPTMRFLADGHRFIWRTERTGRAQYELRDLDGARIATLTRNGGPVIGIAQVKEKMGDAGVLFYRAYDEHEPLDVHLYRVDLDGTDARRLTSADGHHTVAMAPNGRFFITRCETVTDPPITTLHDIDGTRLVTLAEPDPERIAGCLDSADAPVGPPPPAPELFTFTAADGRTELYGWLHKPRGFDPGRRYPLLVEVYGGPGSKGVRNTYRPAHPATELGFLVAKIDNRGTAGRGKAFKDAVYGKLGTVDLDDQAAGVRALARRPYVDGDRVGIHGHSYGGYMAALAVLRYPDVFHVAVAGAPVTDWRNYDTIYTERFMRTPQENAEGYDAGSCVQHAENLRGRLLLLHGMVDDNVHPNNTWQLVKALQEAGKDFEIMLYPDRGHGLGPDAQRRRVEFLWRHLRGGGGS
ncbi:MAG: prolyl oligopeptidase family serine peptidase [Planctomycetes bacterium]|nr:prolyl oligopeptidase family serine peptidase [Planctomycetota bacterium]